MIDHSQPEVEKITGSWKDGSQRVVPWATTLPSLVNLVEMQIPRAHPRPTELEALEIQPRSQWFNKLSR